MKLIIAGSRNFDSLSVIPKIEKLIAENPELKKATEIVSGGARGVDAAAEDYAKKKGLKKKIFYPNWAAHGKAAGPIRNAQMAEYADVLILIWDGQSRGSASMKREMMNRGKPIYELIVGGSR